MAPFRVLSVDGGGIRGVIPARILTAIEAQTNKRISEMFDLIAGTSTGGIIALGLTKPGADGKAEKSAQDLVNLYAQSGPVIFPRTFLNGLNVGLVRGPRYDGTGLDSELQRYFGDARLKNAVRPVLVSSYEIETQNPFFFKSAKAVDRPDFDFPMWQVARATASAPTYFPPEKIPTMDPQYYALIDGGVVAGNPAMCAYAEAIAMTPPGTDVIMVSLGTGDLKSAYKYSVALNWGQLEWAQPIIDIVFEGSNETVDYQLRQILKPRESYFRFQVQLTPTSGGIDDASPPTLKNLLDLADTYIAQDQTAQDLATVCQLLTASTPAPSEPAPAGPN